MTTVAKPSAAIRTVRLPQACARRPPDRAEQHDHEGGDADGEPHLPFGQPDLTRQRRDDRVERHLAGERDRHRRQEDADLPVG
jgi:hypothetical protein